MAIGKKPHRNTSDSSDGPAKQFIAKASKSEPQTPARKVMTTMRFDPGLLQRIDASARKRGISRAAWINYTLSRAIEDEEESANT